jgi:hypothetical protein
MTAIRVKINGKTIHDCSGAIRDSLNQFEGRAAANGYLTIPFDRYNMLTKEADEETSINTGAPECQSFALEIDIDAGASAPAITVYAIQSAGYPDRPIGSLKFLRQYFKTYTGAGTFEMSDLPIKSGESAIMEKLITVQTSATISDIRLYGDNNLFFQRTPAVNNKIQTDGVRVPQSGYNIIDTAEMGYGSEAANVSGYQDFRLQLDVSGADVGAKVVYESIGVLSN